jgi:hypothetical protein
VKQWDERSKGVEENVKRGGKIEGRGRGQTDGAASLGSEAASRPPSRRDRLAAVPRDGGR